MALDETSVPSVTRVSSFAGSDVMAILREHEWLAGEESQGQLAWCERAASLLGPHAAARTALAELIGLIFHYDARQILARVESHVVLSRYAARDVLRRLALLLLEPAAVTPDRFQEIVQDLKHGLDVRGRELFHPVRLALAGRAGEGELDRVVLLLDEAAGLAFAERVKSARERIVEFCSAMD
jgi:nondiscriminating glutamyl-tRNA synthetase